MKILIVHNRYKLAGGEDAVVSAEAEMLREHGHAIRRIEVTNEEIQGLSGKIGAGLALFHSRDSRRTIEGEIALQRPDVVHVHNLFPLLSPSVLYACSRAEIPVVQTLHNFRLLCSNALLFRESMPCEECLGKQFGWAGVRHGCYRGSRIGTFAVAAASAVHGCLHTYERKVSRHIALTRFARDKFVQAGFSADGIDVKPHFVSPDPGRGEGEGAYFLFVGRLSEEKGISTLLAAWHKLSRRTVLKIIGCGPLEDRCRIESIRRPHIEVLGAKTSAEVHQYMGRASAVIVPSECYETFGRVVIESYAKGTPVIASRIGALEELVKHGRTGRFFQPGNPDSLAQEVEWMLAHGQGLTEMRQQARCEYEALYTADSNYATLMQVYERALSKA